MANSIVTNTAAYFAQQNLKSAGMKAELSIARLSSGQRIVRAADDVAALSIGTILRSNVSTLKTALTNTQQGSSLLQVADGALKNVAEILQRQKSLAVQANSGTLSDSERAFLNQEFQSLKDEIDRLVENTKFNQVSLIDGSLSKAVDMTSNTRTSTTAGTAVATAGTIITFANAVPVAGDKIKIQGIEIEFVAASTDPGSVAGQNKVNVADTITGTALNVVNFLNQSTDARLANLRFFNAAGSVQAEWGGGLMDGNVVVSAELITTGTAANFTLGTSANRTISSATANDLDLIGRARVAAVGSISGAILANGGAVAANTAGQALNTRTIEQNPDFIGKLGEGELGLIEVTWVTGETVTMSLQAGDITYRTTAAVDIVDAALTTVTLTGVDQYGTALGGTFDIVINGSSIAATDIDSQEKANVLAGKINDALANVTFTQNRDVTSFQEGEIVKIDGVEVATLDGASVNFRSGDFSGLQVENIEVEAPGLGETDAKITVTINGERYVSFAGIGSKVSINTLIALQSESDPTKAMTIVTGNTDLAGQTNVAWDLTTQDKADALAAALARAFGVEDGRAKIEFQTGNTSTDKIGIEIQSVATVKLYSSLELDIGTANGAIEASDQLDIAINYVTSIRANVGASQSRFDYASATLEVSIQNQDAARSTFLDTDISSESTAFAQAQVLQQASISVLAQANLLPQNLLKLIG